MIANQFKRKGDNLYECIKCCEEVESGVMNIMNHYELCRIKQTSSKEVLANIVILEAIHIIAISEIPVDERSPVYQIFAQRKYAAKQFCDRHLEYRSEVYIEIIEHCNDLIKKCLRIW